jgi:outer membrane protein TolC
MTNPPTPPLLRQIAILILIFSLPAYSQKNKNPSSTTHIKYFWQHFLDHNTSITQARSQILVEQGRQIQWQAQILPQIKTQAIALPLLIEIQTTQTLFRPSINQELQIARLNIQAAEYNLHATLENEIDTLRHTALDYIHAKHIYDKEIHYQNKWQTQLPILQSLFESNQLQAHDLQWAKTQAIAQKQHTLQAHLALQQAQNQLEAITHLSLDKIPSPLISTLSSWNEPSQTISTTPPSWEDLPQYKQIQNQLQSADTHILLIPKQLHPTVEAFAKAEIAPTWLTLDQFGTAQNEDERSNRRLTDQSRFAAGARFYWLIHDGGDTTGQLHAAQATRIQAQIFKKQWEQHYQSTWKLARETLTATEQSLQALRATNTPQNIPSPSQLEDSLTADTITRRQYLDHLLLSRDTDLHLLRLQKQRATALLTLHSLQGENLHRLPHPSR